MRPFVAGLVLAAGASTRLGQPKQLPPFGGTTMLGRVVGETCAAAGLDQVVVVIGGAAAEVRRHVDFGSATMVEILRELQAKGYIPRSVSADERTSPNGVIRWRRH
jgi:CTP:molybdopterin cytidylyltransferase MocA